MALQDIHPVIIARDASATITATLTSLRNFPEVIVYDNGSADDTLAVAGRFANVKAVSGEFLGFGPTKNKAASLASGDWILSIDADESVSEELLAELGELDLSDSRRTFMLHRHNLFMGKEVRWGGWGNDWLVRVYNRRQTSVRDALVHEKVSVPEGTTPVRLEGALWHDSVRDIDQFLHKISYYTELRRREEGKRVYPAAWIAVRSVWSFFRSYVLQLGLLAGWRGLVIAVGDAVGTFFKHMKRYSDRRVRRE